MLKRILAPSLALLTLGAVAVAQSGTLDQVSPATNANFNGSAPSLLWQQEVAPGLTGILEGFTLQLTGNQGAQLTASVRVGPG